MTVGACDAYVPSILASSSASCSSDNDARSRSSATSWCASSTSLSSSSSSSRIHPSFWARVGVGTCGEWVDRSTIEVEEVLAAEISRDWSGETRYGNESDGGSSYARGVAGSEVIFDLRGERYECTGKLRPAPEIDGARPLVFGVDGIGIGALTDDVIEDVMAADVDDGSM